MTAIDTATKCGCGSPVSISLTSGGWQAICYNCYDGTEDAGETAHVRGFGATPDAALWDWQESHDDAWDVTWQLTDLFGELARQVGEEAARQRALA